MKLMADNWLEKWKNANVVVKCEAVKQNSF
jgi:hypothetical protein